ncbi:REL1 protein [Trypanosoma conorhini]|uniref:RNA-editing ligase 1, mitochondrial n=1 Tax=Trypanosoma conorhini TaxID=83891 RepID=A0A3R7MA21_9TRYP|nr:REL1 protein [Trypanosoma conorhini]RNF11729.1 REL1 protein [Trypanosoma conorhini]
MRGAALLRGLLRRPSAAALLACCGGGGSSNVPRGTTAIAAAIAAATRPYMPLPSDQSEFSPYVEIDLPSESRIQAIHRSGLGAQEWVACEKVHGTNFGIYLINLGEQEAVRFSKRSGIMDPNENFFGYHILIDEFSAQVRILCDLLKQKYGLSRIGRVVLNGELFGAKYKHPLVPKSEKWCTMPNGKRFPIAGVEIQREPFPQYSPELHFYAFDIKYSVSGAEEDFVMLGYDEFVEFCSKVPNLLYAKAVVRGTLDDCLAFDVENFYTPLPALLGLGNYPLEGNLAEGVVIRHVRRGDPAVEKHNVATIVKLRCSSFMELKHPGKQKELKETFIDTVRTGALRRVRGDVTVIADSMLPQVEAAANNLLLNNVSDGRLSNVLSKIGREPLLSGEVSEKDVALMLAKDALKDFLKDVDALVLNTSLSFRKMLISNVYFESKKLVAQKWKELIKEEAAAQEAEAAALKEPLPTA